MIAMAGHVGEPGPGPDVEALAGGRAAGVRRMVVGLALDVGLPVAVYYALRLLGASELTALVAATAAAGLRIVWGLLRWRSINQFATIMLLVYGVGVVLALTVADPRVLLLRTSLITASVAALFLVTAAVGRRPLTLAAMQSFAPAQAQRMAEQYRTDPGVRRGFRMTSVVWGVGLLAEAVARVPIVLLLPVDVAVGAAEALFVTVMVALGAWNVWYLRQVRDHFSV